MTPPRAWVLAGHIVPMKISDPQRTFAGRLYIDGDTIVAVKPGSANAPAGFENAPVADCGDAFVYPGLIDLHSHIAYNALPLWAHPGQDTPYLHHDIWPNRSSYKPKVSWPAWVYAAGAPESLMTYIQVRALAGGTTTIQGWPSTNRRPANQLVRNADDQSFEGHPDPVLTSTLVLDRSDLRSKAQRLDEGKGFIYHCSEGLDTSIVTREFEDLKSENCLRQGLIAIHLTAIGATQFGQWATQARNEGDAGPGAVVWSPFSNMWLYGETTKVPDALASDVTVCLGTDWGPSGTKNLLGELKVARIVSDSHGWALSNFDLVAMVTANPGDALSRLWGRTIGRLHSDSVADVAVVARRHSNPWTNLVAAREQDVMMVVVGGAALYGTKSLLAAAGQSRNSSVAVGSQKRRVVLTDPADRDLPLGERRGWYFSRVLSNLQKVRSDPIAAVAQPYATALAAGVDDGGLPDDWLILDLDMPGGPGLNAGPPPEGTVVHFDPLPTMTHDRRWLQSLRGNMIHGGLLDGLDTFYV
jgi:cytosine/adenosine deaminase-related metal-dependent hydrolase